MRRAAVVVVLLAAMFGAGSALAQDDSEIPDPDPNDPNCDPIWTSPNGCLPGADDDYDADGDIDADDLAWLNAFVSHDCAWFVAHGSECDLPPEEDGSTQPPGAAPSAPAAGATSGPVAATPSVTG